MDKINIQSGNALVYELKEFVKNKTFKKVGVTGIKKLDDVVGGFETGKIYTIVAAPGVGKTMLGVQIFHETLRVHGKCLYISTEMVRPTLVARMVTRISGVAERAILRDEVYPNLQGAVDQGYDELFTLFAEKNAFISEPVYELNQLLKIIDDAISQYGVEMIILDHFHNIRSKGGDYNTIVDATHKIQERVVKNNVSFVCFAQMSKADVKSTDTETKMARGASDLYDVSDVFIVLERNKIKSAKTDPEKMKITVTKNRWDETGEVTTKISFPRKIIEQSVENFVDVF